LLGAERHRCPLARRFTETIQLRPQRKDDLRTILADDLGYADLAVNGSKDIPTRSGERSRSRRGRRRKPSSDDGDNW